MVRLKDIPAEVRWEIATKSANSQSVILDMLVRQIIGDRIDEIWNIIMSQGGKESKAVAESLGLPASNAMEIGDTLDIISTILLGPEFKGVILEANEDRVIAKLTGCPLLNAHRNIGHGRWPFADDRFIWLLTVMPFIRFLSPFNDSDLLRALRSAPASSS
jgi:hypothetical protein